MNLVTNVTHYLRRLINQPLDEMTRAQQALRYAIDLGRHAYRTLVRDHAPQMAAALTFRTIFSIVPVVVLALLVFRSFYASDEAQEYIHKQVYSFLNIEALQTASPENGDVQRQIDELITQFTANAYSISFQSVGGMGLLLLVWAALALLITIEQCFNRVYNAPAGRPWTRRIAIYWTVLTLGPVVLVVGVYLTEMLALWASDIPVASTLFDIASRFTGLGATWLLLLMLYMLMPNVRVRLRSALIGGFTAAVLWRLAQGGFALYVHNAVGPQQIYGSLGLVPLTLFWLYLSWLIVLFGLEIAYTLQTVHRYRLQQHQAQLESEMIGDPLWLIPMMAQIAAAFAQARTVDRQALADTLGMPVRVIDRLADKLEQAELIHQVHSRSGRDANYSLAVPPQSISITRLLELGRSLTLPEDLAMPAPTHALLKQLALAQHEAAGGATLATLVDGVQRARET